MNKETIYVGTGVGIWAYYTIDPKTGNKIPVTRAGLRL
jgi:hypothetical protein